MEQRQLGRSGLRVSRLALGTMTWGGHTDAPQAAEQLTAFRDAGGTLVETAPSYQDGASERMLGDLIGSAVDRDELVIATQAGGPRGPRPVDGGTSRAALLHALDGSLRRLGVDHIDLWQVQGFDPRTPLAETHDALRTAITSGKVRYTGICDHSGWQLATAAASGTPVSHQVEYSLLQRGPEREIVPAAVHHGIGLLPWAPLGRGVLTGKYRNATPPDSRGADPRCAAYVEHHRTERASRIVEAVFTAADGLGTSPVAVALAWIRDREAVTAPVLGARTPAQLTAALAAETVQLPPAIQSALDDVSTEPERQN